MNDSDKRMPTPKEIAEARYKKERSDVTKSLGSIEGTIRGILEKKDKVINATNKNLAKQYKKQLKDSSKYLEHLFKTLKDEMFEAVTAEIELEKVEHE